MSKATHTHAMLLAMQLASVFKYVADVGHHREIYKSFNPLEDDVITYEYVEAHGRKGRVSVDVKIITDRSTFIIRQWYNFGILLELELNYVSESGETRSFMSDAYDALDGDNATAERMIDFEYAISIFTEHVASQLHRFERG